MTEKDIKNKTEEEETTQEGEEEVAQTEESQKTYPELYQDHVTSIGDESYRNNAKSTITQSLEPSSSDQQGLFKENKAKASGLSSPDGLFKKNFKKEATLEESEGFKKKKKRKNRNKKKKVEEYRPQFIQNSYGTTSNENETLTGGFSTSEGGRSLSEGARFEPPNSRIQKLIVQINNYLNQKKTSIEGKSEAKKETLIDDLDTDTRVKLKDKIRDRTDPDRRDNQLKNYFRKNSISKDLGTAASSDFTENSKNVPVQRNARRFKSQHPI